MRTLYLILTLLFISAHTIAQVSTEVSYDKDTKELTLTLTNHYDTYLFLSPKFTHDCLDTSFCWYEVWWKDKDSSIVAHRVADQIYGPRRIDSFIEPKETNSYKFNLKNKSPKVKWVEIHFNIETRTLNKQNKVERWKKEITKVYEY